MDRIAIIGCSGGGKSSLSRQLGARLNLPLVHLDVLFWRPGWVESDYPSFRERLAAAISGGRWITDGNFSKAGDLHFAGAQMVVWVDQPRTICLRRALWRAVKGAGRRRPDMAEGCEEKIDLEFLRYIWNWNRDTRPRIEAAIANHAPTTPVARLTSDAAIKTWLESVAPVADLTPHLN